MQGRWRFEAQRSSFSLGFPYGEGLCLDITRIRRQAADRLAGLPSKLQLLKADFGISAYQFFALRRLAKQIHPIYRKGVVHEPKS